MNLKLLFVLVGIVVVVMLTIVPLSNAFALSNQTNSYATTESLLKQLIKIENTTQALHQSNANVIATKLDIIKVLLEQIKTGLANPLPIPPPPPAFGMPLPNGTSSPLLPPGTACQLVNNSMICPFQPIPPPINPGCGIGSDNSLCNVPIPPLPPLLPPNPECIYTVYGVFCPTP